jgi:hypothetical protein
MIELVKGSTELSNNSAMKYAANLLRHYSFELDEFTIDQLLSYWSDNYPVNWVRLATIEALYQGRYKAVSVEQILVLWKRRGQPVHHFNHEFERLVCDKFPRDLLSPADPVQARKKSFPTGKTSVSARVGPFQYQSLLQQLQPQSQSPDSLLKQSQPSHTIGSSLPLSTGNPPELNPPLTATEDEAKEEQGDKNHEQHNEEQLSPDVPEVPVSEISVSEIPIQFEAVPDQPQSETDRSPEKVELSQNEAGAKDRLLEVSNVSDREQLPSKSETGQPPIRIESPAEPLSEASSSQQLSILLFTVEHILPGLNLTAPSLKPKLKLQLTTLYQPKWLIGDGSNHPIHQFTPAPESSDFHSKLRSVAQSPQ